MHKKSTQTFTSTYSMGARRGHARARRDTEAGEMLKPYTLCHVSRGGARAKAPGTDTLCHEGQ